MTRPHTLRDYLIRAAERVAIAWSALVLAAFVLVVLPVNMRVA